MTTDYEKVSYFENLEQTTTNILLPLNFTLENPFRKLAQLKKVERSNELASAFNRPRPQALDLRRIERGELISFILR